MTSTTQPPVFVPKLEPAGHFIRPGQTAPRLQPLPASLPQAQGLNRAEILWAHYWDLDKQPLRIKLHTGGQKLLGHHHLDAVLGRCQLWVLDYPWPRPDEAPRIIPLPLDLLGIVTVPRRGKKKCWPKLPVWAATPLEHKQQGTYEALCIGNRQKIEWLLSYMIRMADVPIEWEVLPLELNLDEARELISVKRPMSGKAQHFTPPYRWDWLK